MKRPGFRLAHKLYRQAFAIGKTAQQLRDVGMEGSANALDSAARSLSDAASAVEKAVEKAMTEHARRGK